MLLSGTIFAATQPHHSTARTVFEPLSAPAATAGATARFEAIKRVAFVAPLLRAQQPQSTVEAPVAAQAPSRSYSRDPVRKRPSAEAPAGKPRRKGAGYAVPAGVGDHNAALAFALSKVGQRYKRNGSADGGWDCSGLVSTAYARAGVALPHSSGRIGSMGRAVPRGQWQAGDVIHTSGHVALYLGNGMMVEAANPRDGVRVTRVRGGTARRF